MAEQDCFRVTYDLTMAAAQTLARLDPAMTFVYVSGAGTDSTEKGRAMWARALLVGVRLVEYGDSKATSTSTAYRVFLRKAIRAISATHLQWLPQLTTLR